MKMELWHAFVLGAILSWGVYVPVLHEGQMTIGGDVKSKSLRGFLCVGVAYFLTAVVLPVILLLIQGQSFEFSGRGVTFATLGGIAGAAGALCIILSIGAGGSPMYIAPLVFAGAPIVNVFVSLLWKSRHVPGPLFFVGLLMAAVGAGLVLYSKSDLDKKLKEQAKPVVQQTGGAFAQLPASSPGEH